MQSSMLWMMERVGSLRTEVQIMRMPQKEAPSGVARKRSSSSERTVNMLGGVSWRLGYV